MKICRLGNRAHMVLFAPHFDDAVVGYGFNPDCPLGRHTGEGRYPAIKNHREAVKIMMLSHLRGKFLIIWIPAFAGMTRFFLMDNLGLSVRERLPGLRTVISANDEMDSGCESLITWSSARLSLLIRHE